MMRVMRSSLASVLLLLPAQVAAERCAGRLLDAGDTQYSVRLRCGEPWHVAGHTETRTVVEDHDTVRHQHHRIEDWLYDRGPGRGPMVVRFRNGRLVDAGTAGPIVPGRSSCARGLVPRGATVGEVILACGVPAARDTWHEEIVDRPRRAVEVRRRVTHETLTYDFGKRRARRTFRFENGRLEDIGDAD